MWSDFGNPWKRKPYLDNNAPKEYLDGVEYGSPGGLDDDHALAHRHYLPGAPPAKYLTAL